MKRSTAALAAALVVAGGFATATTASNALPESTAGQQAVTVTGASMKRIGYTVTGGVITGFTVQLKGPPVRTVLVGGLPTVQTLFSTVTARFDNGTQRTCVLGVYDATNDRTPATCLGFTQTASRSWRLTITVT